MKGIEPEMVRFFVGFCRNRVCLPLIRYGIVGNKDRGCEECHTLLNNLDKRCVFNNVDVRREEGIGKEGRVTTDGRGREFLGERPSCAQHKSHGLSFCGGVMTAMDRQIELLIKFFRPPRSASRTTADWLGSTRRGPG